RSSTGQRRDANSALWLVGSGSRRLDLRPRDAALLFQPVQHPRDVASLCHVGGPADRITPARDGDDDERVLPKVRATGVTETGPAQAGRDWALQPEQGVI